MKVITERLIKFKPQLFLDVIDTINFDRLKNPTSLRRKIEEFISNVKSCFEVDYECHELIVNKLGDDEKISLKNINFRNKF